MPQHDDQVDDYEVTMAHQKRRNQEKGCCSAPKLAVFFLFLGVTFGLVFWLVDLDKINGLINNGDTGTNTTDPGDGSTNDDEVGQYQFMQCPTSEGSECCNGLESNCDLRPNELLWATVHNANHDDKLIANHEAPLEGALEAGYRGLMLDACLCPDKTTGELLLEFCHSVCGIGRREPIEVFTNINTFLNDNPSEIIFINIEISSGSPSPALIWQSILEAGLKRKSYIHDGQNDFPTMRDLLLDRRQLIISKHRGNDCTNTSTEGCTPRIFEYFNHVVENNYSFNNVAAIEDTASFCAPFRGVDGQRQFYSINHFITTALGPSKNYATKINQKSFIEKTIEACKAETGYDANFINVDFWQTGDLPRVTQEVNIARAAKAQQKRSLIRRTIDKTLSWFLK